MIISSTAGNNATLGIRRLGTGLGSAAISNDLGHAHSPLGPHFPPEAFSMVILQGTWQGQRPNRCPQTFAIQSIL